MGDFIDREQAIRFAGYSAAAMYKRGYLDEYYALERFEETLGRIPAADVAPVVHGQWIYGEFDIPHCSECGRDVMPNRISPYCPNCGAKMDEEEQNGNV